MSVTIHDIAKEVGVSLATVSRVLNNSGYVKQSTRDKVMKAIEEMEYVPSAIARQLSKKETNTIGVIVPDITNTYFGEIIKGISHVADEEGFNIILFNTNDEIEKELKALGVVKEQRLRGVIMAPMFGESEFNAQYIKSLESLEIPIIFVSSDVKHTYFSGVFVDDVKGGFDATNLLIEQGHTRIGIITGLLSSGPSADRLIGYKKALATNNIAYEEAYVFKGDFKFETGYNYLKEILKMENGPTGVVIGSNRMTLGAIKGIYEAQKKIPEDIAIVAFNKLDFLDVVGINITYLEEDPIKLGIEAMKILEKTLVNGAENKNRMIVSHTIVSRGSEAYIK